jgi:hypothetical protein
MTVATITGICVALLIAAGAYFFLRARSMPTSVVGRVLRWAAVAVTVGVAIATLPAALDDSPSVPYLLAVPVLAALLAAVADVTGRAVVILTSAAALVMLAMGLFFAMFLTPYFLVPALVLGLAALASIRPRDVPANRSQGRPAVNP